VYDRDTDKYWVDLMMSPSSCRREEEADAGLGIVIHRRPLSVDGA
jgi:hypothetical protein